MSGLHSVALAADCQYHLSFTSRQIAPPQVDPVAAVLSVQAMESLSA